MDKRRTLSRDEALGLVRRYKQVIAPRFDVEPRVMMFGAYLPLMVPRMKSLTLVMQTHNMVGDIDWEANLAALYYDLAGAHSPEVIRMLLTITTPDHLLYGSDYPYVAPQVLTGSLKRMKQYLTTEPDLAPFKDMILYKNARSLWSPLPTSPLGEENIRKVMQKSLGETRKKVAEGKSLKLVSVF